MLEADEMGLPLSDDDMAGRVGERRGFQPFHSQSVPKSENLERQASERAGTGCPVTTMMLRNIPNKYTQNTLLQEIDDSGLAGTYDFFYLPMDVHNRSNVGYAFINFLSPEDAQSFRNKFSDHRFERFQSRKISSVCAAHVQGLDDNLHHFKNRAVTQARNSQYRPIVLKGSVRIDFEEALEAAKPRSSPTAVKITPPSAPGPARRPPRGLTVTGNLPMSKPDAAQARKDREALELVVRDLAVSLQFGQMQRAAAAKSACMGYIAPPPGLAGHSLSAADSPAYVSLPSFVRPRLGECGSEASTMDCFSFSRTVTEE